MNIETSANNHRANLFCSFERSDIVQISNITFHYFRISAGKAEAMGRFGIELLSSDNTWSTRYNISKKDSYSKSSTDWNLVTSNFNVESLGEIDL